MANDPGVGSARRQRGVKISDAYWDAVVVGAGVAGGVAAAMLAEQGWRVLLVEKSAWPREKVCGGCLNAAAVEVLREIGIDAALWRAEPIDSVVWHVGRRSLELTIPREAAVSRADLDAAIALEANRRGCEFLSEFSATLLPLAAGDSFRALKLQSADVTAIIRAGVVLACDGIGGTLLAGEPWARWHISPGAWMGVSGTCEISPGEFRPGAIHMHVGTNGYVGMVRRPESRGHLAASLDPAACRSAGGPVNLVREILASGAEPLAANLELLRIRGTGALTRRREHLGGHRVLVVGDACGYVEPFTGEGMAWAAIGARQVVTMLPTPDESWPQDLPTRWRIRHHEIIGRRQRWCRGMQPMMHHPAIAAAGILVGSAMPAIAKWIAATVCKPRQKEICNDSPGRFRFQRDRIKIGDGHIGDRDGDAGVHVAGADP
ncbi:MAG: FAD-dependent monooxygenase [Tepidisphaeraceae bacterium]